MPGTSDAWRPLADEQFGVVTRRQLLSAGMTRSQARTHLDSGRWRVVLPGVYITHTGPMSSVSGMQAALLYAGAGAAISHATALWLDGVVDGCPPLVHLSIPAKRQVTPADGLRIHRARHLALKVHPAATPTRTRIEHSVLDHVENARIEAVVDTITRSVQRRRTTAAHLRLALDQRNRHPHRSLIAEILTDVDHGVQSPLERRYFRDVERAHRLPRGVRNAAEPSAAGTRYRDVRYRGWSTVVELDGRAAHPDDSVFRDLKRDNQLVLAGDTVLRFGWHDLAADPCAVAAQVAAALSARGWPGTLKSCGRGCTA